MTLMELVDKLDKIIQDNLNKKNNISKNEIQFFAEDEYQTFDVKIDNVEIEDNKIFLS